MTDPDVGLALLPKQVRSGVIPAVVVMPDGLPPRVVLFSELPYAQTYRDQQSDPAVVVMTETTP